MARTSYVDECLCLENNVLVHISALDIDSQRLADATFPLFSCRLATERQLGKRWNTQPGMEDTGQPPPHQPQPLAEGPEAAGDTEALGGGKTGSRG